MAIVGQNSILTQYVPSFYIDDIEDGQTVFYDSQRKAFVNRFPTGSVSPSGGISVLQEVIMLSDIPVIIGNIAAGSIITSVKVITITPDTGQGTLTIGNQHEVDAYMNTEENDIQTVGIYIAETCISVVDSVNVVATCQGVLSGMVRVIVEYTNS